MIIDYCDCDIKRKLGRLVEAKVLRERARNYFKEVGREHWWTGLGTFLLDWLKFPIQDSGIDARRDTVAELG